MPYTSSTSDGKVTVYKKIGKKKKVVGHTTPGKKDAYLAALHINSKDKDKKNENMEFDNQIGDIYAVARPHDGCEVGTMVHKVDPMFGIQNLEPQQVHGFYPDEDSAMGVAQGLYEDQMKKMQMLEKRKDEVIKKIKETIDALEAKRTESVNMIKENPKDSAKHKDSIARLATKIDDLMTKLEKIEKSKKEIKKDEDKKKDLKEEKKYTLGVDKARVKSQQYFVSDSEGKRKYFAKKEDAEKYIKDKKDLNESVKPEDKLGDMMVIATDEQNEMDINDKVKKAIESKGALINDFAILVKINRYGEYDYDLAADQFLSNLDQYTIKKRSKLNKQ